MNSAKGYYSLIQYCPDRTRLEAATIGVLLFCPERDFLKAMTVRSNRRIARFFGRQGHDWQRINSFKHAIQERVEVERSSIQTVANLEEFISLRANQLQITPPRSMCVHDPEEDLKALFHDIVGDKPRTPDIPKFQRYVGERLRAVGLERKVRTNIPVTVPVFNQQMSIPYGFQNERFHLIQPVSFLSLKPSEARDKACRYAVEGRSLYDAPAHSELGRLRLVVVGNFRSREDKLEQVVGRVLADSPVELFARKDIGRLIDEIRQTGKDIVDAHCTAEAQ
jgi:hypothetical protein